MAPQVLESTGTTRVVWSSLWPSRPDDQIVIELRDSDGETELEFSLQAAGDPPDTDTTSQIRHRVRHLLFADLRESYGQ